MIYYYGIALGISIVAVVRWYRRHRYQRIVRPLYLTNGNPTHVVTLAAAGVAKRIRDRKLTKNEVLLERV